MAKDLYFSSLLDYYGQMLTEKQRNVLILYYNEDLSLSEISELVSISRQGVMDIIKRAEKQLTLYEEGIKYSAVAGNIRTASEKISKLINDTNNNELKKELTDIYNILNSRG